MSKYRVPAPVQSAIQNVRAALEDGKKGWNISIRNEKVVFTAPDGVNLTVGMNPNAESLKKFVREATRYNLIDGPVRTPAEAEALVKVAEEEALKAAEAENRKRKEYEAAQAQKKAEAKVAAQKAAEATMGGLKTAAKTEAPLVPSQVSSTRASGSKSVFPKFDKALIGSMDYSKFQLSDGRYYCVECLGEGIEFTARKPQGLATHRGFRHQMYQGEGGSPQVAPETSRVVLPDDVHDAIELLKSIMVEHIGTGGDSAKVAELEAALTEVKQQAEQDLKKADADYQSLKKTSEESLKAAKAKIHQLSEELSGKTGRQEAETKALMKSFSELLNQVHQAINTMSPVQAVGKVEELIRPYLQA